jgi:hypothetical protein
LALAKVAASWASGDKGGKAANTEVAENAQNVKAMIFFMALSLFI